MNYAALFQFNVICMVCREKIKSSEATKRWDGLIVGKNHEGCFEYRHPNDMPLSPVKDDAPLPFTSPEETETNVPVCSAIGLSGIVGRGIVGCMVVGGDDLGGLDFEVPSGSFSTSTL